MKIKFILLAGAGCCWLSASSLCAQTNNAGTNSLPLTQTLKYQVALESERSLGESSLLPPGLKEKLKLTDEERSELKPIEDDFAKTSQAYQTANQPRIDAALEANRQARESKSALQIQAARHQLQLVWAGLQKYRDDSVRQVKLVLTPEQITILDDPANQWHENHGSEVNDPSSN
jgi:outer membrane translocation and assembly module TamA